VGGACGKDGRVEKSVQGFNGKAQRKRPLRRPRHRWEGGIKMDLRDIGWVGMDWIHLAQGRDQWWAIVNTLMNLRVLVPQS
jgi:hypothetical protein